MERAVREMVNGNTPRDQLKTLSDDITDLKNDLMQAKHKISLTTEDEHMLLTDSFSPEKEESEAILLNKMETLKTSITDLTYDLMMFQGITKKVEDVEKVEKDYKEGGRCRK